MAIATAEINKESTEEATQHYVVVSTDTHAGPSPVNDLRSYCPKKYLDEFDQFTSGFDPSDGEATERQAAKYASNPETNPVAIEASQRTKSCPGQTDIKARLADMDADGVAAEVIFAGGGNGQPLPFIGSGLGAGRTGYADELRLVGNRIWNAWLADFVSVEPHRHVGVIQIPIWDVDAAVAEIRWAHAAGLKAVNLPAPRRDFAAYNDPSYDPLWAVCEELSLPLETHAAGGEAPLGFDGPGGPSIFLAENTWLSRRAIWELIFGGVFERFPGLKFVLTETRIAWAPVMINDLDSIHRHFVRDLGRTDVQPHSPREYWERNCFLAGSFLAPYEAAMLDDVGKANLMWGSDYPHREGTWPSTRLAMRNTFWSMPHEDVANVLGRNAVEVFSLDPVKLGEVADRIGPTHAELDQPVADGELPTWRARAFREYGAFA